MGSANHPVKASVNENGGPDGVQPLEPYARLSPDKVAESGGIANVWGLDPLVNHWLQSCTASINLAVMTGMMPAILKQPAGLLSWASLLVTAIGLVLDFEDLSKLWNHWSFWVCLIIISLLAPKPLRWLVKILDLSGSWLQRLKPGLDDADPAFAGS